MQQYSQDSAPKTSTPASEATPQQVANKPTAQFADNREANMLQRQQQTIIQRANKTGLPDNIKSGVESLSGVDISDVRVHRNSAKPSSVQAHAYTQGTNIHVAPGQDKHIAHEAWHVVQQKQGRVQPTTSVNGMAVNDNVGLEMEADVMGGKALQMKGKGSMVAAQKKSDVMQGIGFVDNRSEATAQKTVRSFFTPNVKVCPKSSGKVCTQMTKKIDALAYWHIHSNERDSTAKDVDAIANNIAVTEEDGRTAEGLLHAMKETRRAAASHYSEINYTAANISFGGRLGVSNQKEPDVVVGSRAVEIKRNDTTEETDVDKLVANGLDQLKGRIKDIDGMDFNNWSLKMVINEKENYWPWTASQANVADYSNAYKLRDQTYLRRVFPDPSVGKWIRIELVNLGRPCEKIYSIKI